VLVLYQQFLRFARVRIASLKINTKKINASSKNPHEIIQDLGFGSKFNRRARHGEVNDEGKKGSNKNAGR
jgi:hypothetical protein